MERRIRRSSSTNNHDMAVVKAAAWAWYQHGSGSQGKDMHECFHDISTRIRREPPKPSRYKLEAIKLAQEQEEAAFTKVLPQKDEEEETGHDQSLFDTYEIERISKQLELLIEYNQLHQQNVSDDEEARNMMIMVKKKKKKKVGGVLWFRHGLACSTSIEDVIEKKMLGDRRRPTRK